jgi:hypothetical protein
LEWVDHGVSHVTFTPVWTLRRGHPLPQLGFEPAHSPFRQEWLAAIDAAHQAGLQTQLHPGLVWPGGPATDWWRVTSRDEVWWSVWFDRYQAFMESYASLAQEARVERLVMGGPAVAPALPGGLLPGGSPSGVSQEAQLRWGEIIAGVRQIYSGRLAFELELGDELQSPPAFLDRFDELQIYWRASLGERNDLEPDEMQAEAARWIDEVLLATPELEGLPLILSVEYLSIDGSATGCPRAPDFSCRSPEAFDRGQIGDPDLQLDLWEQGAAINAVLMEAYQNTAIEGFYIRRYDPALALQDKSASVNGKPAADVLWYWYPRIQGES